MSGERPTVGALQARSVSLDDKYAMDSGRVLISGIQALVRTMLEQRRLDDAAGLDTRGFASGYQGSPLGGLDLEMQRAARHLDDAGVVFQAALNEELAATAVAGTQLLARTRRPRHDGVTGYWYGKNPGLDRAADAIRHANMMGTARVGGAVAWIGDDPNCKSSTLPSSCEAMCQSLAMPLLAPASVGEILEFGLHAVALSRAAQLWTGVKIVADIADASEVIDLDAWRPHPTVLTGQEKQYPLLLGPAALEAERDLFTRRLARASEYARTAGLNRIMFSAQQPSVAVLAPGLTFAILQRALADMAIDEAAMQAAGLRLIRIGMPYPLDAEHIRELTAGVSQILVMEDKLPIIEGQVKQAWFGHDYPPAVAGRGDGAAGSLFPVGGSVSAEQAASALARVLGPDRLPRAAATRLATQTRSVAKPRTLLPTVARTPYFCSGCPHNLSTRAGEDTLVGVGIGCHAMVALDSHGRGSPLGVTQMGGEGAQWIGLASFTDDSTFVQNLGDGTFHHSGSLAVRAAVAAGVTMTYKLLYNDAVAMTGGQRVEGRLDVPSLTRLLHLEGVRRIVITTPEPKRYRRVKLAPIATVRHRDELLDLERELAAQEGVSVLIHDDRCAAEERRLRKRGKLETPAERVVINERVCEGCGDCGEASTCLSVQPVDSVFGPKTRIHQASCNSDMSCLNGDCPSFLLVKPSGRLRQSLPEPPKCLPPDVRVSADEVLLRMPGIGGTGVVTVSQILAMAAHLDGKYAATLDQTGLAQKGGAVVSDVRIGKQPTTGALRSSAASVDVLLGFDVLGAGATANLAVCDTERTVAVVNTAVTPTAAMVTRRDPVPDPSSEVLLRLDAVTKSVENLYLDAGMMAEKLFGDHMPANMLLLGAAFQHGCIPLSAESIEAAIELNGAAVDKTLGAFRWGRAHVGAPHAVEAALADSQPAVVQVTARDRNLTAAAGVAGPVREPVALLVADLTAYQNVRYAQRFADRVAELQRRVAARVGDDHALPIAAVYAAGLHKLMAYKDEYEVARLHLDPAERNRLEHDFGPRPDVTFLLHPPVLRALGLRRKLRLRRSAPLAFRLLRASRRVRGTRLDPFGYASLRRVERELVNEYVDLGRRAAELLDETNVDQVVAMLRLVEDIRGYEELKLVRIEAFRRAYEEALRGLAAAPTGSRRP